MKYISIVYIACAYGINTKCCMDGKLFKINESLMYDIVTSRYL